MKTLVILFSWSVSFIFNNSIASSKEVDSLVVSLAELLATDKPTTPPKKALRYGFHRTKECQNFELAFLCVQKCLDLGYDVAHSGKNCVCTCYRNKIKAQYMKKSSVTRWRLGAPTTKLPLWARTTQAKESREHENPQNVNDNEGDGNAINPNNPNASEKDPLAGGAAVDDEAEVNGNAATDGGNTADGGAAANGGTAVDGASTAGDASDASNVGETIAAGAANGEMAADGASAASDASENGETTAAGATNGETAADGASAASDTGETTAEGAANSEPATDGASAASEANDAGGTSDASIAGETATARAVESESKPEGGGEAATEAAAEMVT